jgi:glycosyltransferase involved in cell wall biosynthesis
MTDYPRVSIIVATYNVEGCLVECLDSVFSQNYKNLEVLIIDGGSVDNTIDIIKQYEDKIKFWISEPDSGIYDAWNKGVRLSTGDWVAFLGADDVLLNGAIESYVAAINACQNKSLEYVSSRVNLTVGSKIIRTVGQQWSWRVFRKRMNVPHVGSMHHRSLFERIGLFDVSYKICGDYEFLLRRRSELQTLFVDMVTVNMSVSGVSSVDLKIHHETERAKVLTGGRNSLISKLEKVVAIGKWRLRRQLWY